MTQDTSKKDPTIELDQESKSHLSEEQPIEDSKKMSRRGALGLLAKHSLYTAPAVMTYLSLKSKSALAGSSGTIEF